MTYLIGIIFMVVGIIIAVALHELGHLLPAKRFGALVPEYWIGFGPKLLSKRIRGTEYGIKAILLGGYVRIVGMFPPGDGEAVASSEKRQTLVQEARQQSAEEIRSAQASGLKGVPFYQLTTGKKLVIMSGGPLMNLFLAFLLTAGTLMGLGWNQPTTTIEEVLTTGSGLNVDQDAEMPALAAGMQAGDTIIKWGGTAVDNWGDLSSLIGQTPKAGTEVQVRRGEEELTLHVTPIFDGAGTARIGIAPENERVKGSLTDALSTTGTMFTGTANALIRLPVSLWKLGESFFAGAERDPNGVMSVVGVARVAGEVSSADAGAASVSVLDRLAVLLSLLASLNMALFVFNLIPLPPLDGGHIAGALWGGFKNLWARALRRPLPGPPDTARMVPLANGVFVALMIMTVVLVGADLFKPVALF